MHELHLAIKTNMYAGCFDKQLMAYVFGYDSREEYVRDEIKLFYNEEGRDLADKFFKYFDFVDVNGVKKCFFTSSHPQNDVFSRNTVFVVLKQKLPDMLYDVVRKRLKKFVEYYNNTNEAIDELKISNLGYYIDTLVKNGNLEY